MGKTKSSESTGKTTKKQSVKSLKDKDKASNSKDVDAIAKKAVDAAADKSKKLKSPVSKAKKAKAGKKNEEGDLDDALLSDEVESSEDIPDLAEFEESTGGAAEVDEADSDDDDADEELSATPAAQDGDDEIILTDAEGRRLCRVRECDQAATVETYCRFHYLQNWKRIQVRRKILADGKLERYVDELTSRYPDKFLEMIRKDVRTEKDFLTAIAELEIDESGLDNDFEDESQNFIDEVRGVTENTISDEEDF